MLTTTTPCTIRAPSRADQIGSHRVHEIGAVDLAHAGDVVAGQAPLELRLAGAAQGQVGEGGIRDVDPLLARGGEHGDPAQPELLLLLGEVQAQRGVLRGVQEVVARHDVGDLLGVAEGGGFEVLVVRLGHGQGLVEGPLDLGLEPSVDRPIDDRGGDDDDQDGGDQGQEEKGEDELGLELRGHDLLPALEPELHEVPEEQHHQQQEHDGVEVEEQDHGEVGRHRAGPVP